LNEELKRKPFLRLTQRGVYEATPENHARVAPGVNAHARELARLGQGRRVGKAY